jgi:hypothetical protein
MKLRLIFYFFAIATFIFFKFLNHHLIMKYEAKYDLYSRKYESEKIISGELRLQYSELCGRERIEKLAVEKLGMFYPNSDLADVRYIREAYANRTPSFTLIDYLVPSVEALTR